MVVDFLVFTAESVQAASYLAQRLLIKTYGAVIELAVVDKPILVSLTLANLHLEDLTHHPQAKDEAVLAILRIKLHSDTLELCLDVLIDVLIVDLLAEHLASVL